jgi:hypothetical protein
LEELIEIDLAMEHPGGGESACMQEATVEHRLATIDAKSPRCTKREQKCAQYRRWDQVELDLRMILHQTEIPGDFSARHNHLWTSLEH